MRLLNQRFATVDDVNEALAPLLEQLNAKAFQKLPGSRANAFAQLDAPALKPLPRQNWELAVNKTVWVHIDQHSVFEGYRYSVHQALVSQILKARVKARTVELLDRVSVRRSACGISPALCAKGWLHHSGRAPVVGPPGASGVDLE